MMSYVIVAGLALFLLALFAGGRKLIGVLFKAVYAFVNTVLLTAFGMIIKAHIDFLSNLMPRKVVIKSLEGQTTSKKKE